MWSNEYYILYIMFNGHISTFPVYYLTLWWRSTGAWPPLPRGPVRWGWCCKDASLCSRFCETTDVRLQSVVRHDVFIGFYRIFSCSAGLSESLRRSRGRFFFSRTVRLHLSVSSVDDLCAVSSRAPPRSLPASEREHPHCAARGHRHTERTCAGGTSWTSGAFSVILLVGSVWKWSKPAGGSSVDRRWIVRVFSSVCCSSAHSHKMADITELRPSYGERPLLLPLQPPAATRPWVPLPVRPGPVRSGSTQSGLFVWSRLQQVYETKMSGVIFSESLHPLMKPTPANCAFIRSFNV